jgi:hypothetical protein
MEKPVIIITIDNRLKKLKNKDYYKLFEKEEFLSKHKIVIISNYPKEKLNVGN